MLEQSDARRVGLYSNLSACSLKMQKKKTEARNSQGHMMAGEDVHKHSGDAVTGMGHGRTLGIFMLTIVKDNYFSNKCSTAPYEGRRECHMLRGLAVKTTLVCVALLSSINKKNCDVVGSKAQTPPPPYTHTNTHM